MRCNSKRFKLANMQSWLNPCYYFKRQNLHNISIQHHNISKHVQCNSRCRVQFILVSPEYIPPDLTKSRQIQSNPVCVQIEHNRQNMLEGLTLLTTSPTTAILTALLWKSNARTYITNRLSYHRFSTAKSTCTSSCHVQFILNLPRHIPPDLKKISQTNIIRSNSI